MNHSHAFYIGKKHNVCEDYCISGVTGSYTLSGVPMPGDQYIIVSDGCSGGRNADFAQRSHTDFGSRLLVKSAEAMMQDFNQITEKRADFYFSNVIVQASRWANEMRLPRKALDATLLVAHSNGVEWNALMHGDGLFARRHQNGDLEAFLVSYEKSMPYYPSYRLDAKNELDYEERNITKYVERFFWHEGELTRQKETSDKAVEAFNGKNEDFQWIALCSDGVDTLSYKRTTSTIEPGKIEDSILRLFDFKVMTGEFVPRTVNFWLKKAAREDGHYEDDLSVASINFS